MLIPMFLIISSSVYPAIISGIQNKEMALMAEALAQLQAKNSKGDSSGYHANIQYSPSLSSTPITASPSPTTSLQQMMPQDMPVRQLKLQQNQLLRTIMRFDHLPDSPFLNLVLQRILLRF
jgi:hypothetical protein